MNALDLVNMMKAAGAQLALTPSGRLRITGDPVQIDRWLASIAQYEPDLIAALRATADTPGAAR